MMKIEEIESLKAKNERIEQACIRLKDETIKGVEIDISFSEEMIESNFPDKSRVPTMEKCDGSTNPKTTSLPLNGTCKLPR